MLGMVVAVGDLCSEVDIFNVLLSILFSSRLRIIVSHTSEC